MTIEQETFKSLLSNCSAMSTIVIKERLGGYLYSLYISGKHFFSIYPYLCILIHFDCILECSLTISLQPIKDYLIYGMNINYTNLLVGIFIINDCQ